MAELDHDAIKTRIADILRANTTTLYDSTGADPNKLRVIKHGHPDNKDGFDNPLPSLYITNANPLERISLQGTTTSSDALPCLLHQIRYKIVFAIDRKDARMAEQQLDGYQQIILDTLEADNKLKNGGAALVDSSRPEMVETFQTSRNHKPLQGRIITYLVIKQT